MSNYTKTIWNAGDPITAEKMNNLETGVKTINQQQENIIATINSMTFEQNTSGQNPVSTISDIEIVENIAALTATTANKVLVLHDDSNWGTGGPCWFVKSDAWRTYGYQRSDSSYVFPTPDQAPIPDASAPREQLMNVIYTWIGNLALHHGESFNNDLFSTNCAKDSDNLYEMDCSAFVNAVLLGITYENSRYVLGQSADNIELQYMSSHMGSSKSSYMPKGGLQSSESAMWFAEHGRLFTLPTDAKKAADTLQFGDIIFGSSSERKPSSYYNIEHIMFVLGTNSEYVIVAQSTNTTGIYEQQNLKIAHIELASKLESGYLQVFARPNYNILLQTPAITPYQQGTYRYNAFLLPIAQIKRPTDTGDASSRYRSGEIYTDSYSAATPDYLPVIPLSTLKYVGPQQNARGIDYMVRCYEYDQAFSFIKVTTIAYKDGSNYIRTNHTLDATTKYVRFTHYISISSGQCIYLADTKDFLVQITPPTVQ